MPDTHAAIARQAAELIETNGWNRDGFRSATGALCAAGAIHTALAPHLDPAVVIDHITCDAVADALPETVGSHEPADTRLGYWNDYLAGGADQVVATLRAFADAQDGGEQP